MSQITVDVLGLVSAQRRLQLMELPPGKRRALIGKITNKIKTKSKQRIAKQTDIEGSAFARRKKPRRDRKKMLSGLAKKIEVTRRTSDESVLSFRNGLMAYIAAKQQHGITETATPETGNARTRANSSSMASRQQAVRLLAAGYRIPRKNKRPSIKWITQNMKSDQAGLLLTILRTEAAKTSWQITVPARSFLGTTPAEAEEFLNTILDQLLGGINGTGNGNSQHA